MIHAADLRRVEPNLPHPERAAELLNRFGQRLLEEGSRRGVTALKTEESIERDLLWDSLAGLASLPSSGRVIDIGTGGGVPGLVLAIVRPDLAFTLTDSARRKTAWVQECVELLGLPNVTVVTSRLELLGRDPQARERFDAVTAKALASLAVLVELALPLLKVGGKLIAYKGPAFDQERQQAEKALRLLRGEITQVRELELADKAYRLVEVVKRAPTGSRYPRRDGLPQKSPL